MRTGPNASHSARTVCPLTSGHKHSWQKTRCVATNSPPPGNRWGRKSASQQANPASADHRFEGRAMLLILGDGVLVSECQSDVVEAFHEAPATEIVDREGPDCVVHAHLTLAKIDNDLLFRLALGQLPDSFDGFLIELNRKQTFLERVAPEDVAEPRRDDVLETPVAQGPYGVLTG